MISDNQRLEDEFFKFYKINPLNRRRGVRARHKKFFTDSSNADVVVDIRDSDIPKESNEDGYENIMIVEIGEGSLQELIHLHQVAYNNSGHMVELARTVVDRQWAEHHLRKEFPSVQAAWEQYSLMLHLSSNGKIID